MITITKSLAGYTRIAYNSEEIAMHHLSATTNGTREAFGIPEEIGVVEWLEKNFENEIEAINKANESTNI